MPHNEVEELQNKQDCLLKVGDKVMTYILKFNPTDKRIALTVNEPEIKAELKEVPAKESSADEPETDSANAE